MAGAFLSDEQTIRSILTGLAELKSENGHLREQITGVKEQARAQNGELRAEVRAVREQQALIVAQLNRWRGAIPVLLAVGGAIYGLAQWGLSFFSKGGA